MGIDCGLTSTDEVISGNAVGLEISPNPAPATSTVRFTAAAEHRIQNIELYTISGQLVDSFKGIDSNQFTLTRNGYGTGMYLAKVQFEDGIVTQKLMFD